MKRLYTSRKGFTLVEIVCVIAIIAILAAVTAISITDHLNNSKRAAYMVQLNRSGLSELDEVFGDKKTETVTITGDNLLSGVTGTNTSTGPVLSGGNAGGGNGSVAGGSGAAAGGTDVGTPAPEPAAAPEEEGDKEPAPFNKEEAIKDLTNTITNYANEHNVQYLPGTEQLPSILAAAEASAVELYEQNGYTDPRYFKYTPATGAVTPTNGSGKSFECKDGQNMIKASLNEDGAASTPGYNVRTLLDSDFLANPSKSIYVGVYKNSDGSYQIVPNVCVDVNGNFNSIITFNFGNNISEVDRSKFNADNPPKTWNGYVAYVTNASGMMMDLSKADMSGYSAHGSTKAQNTTWKSYVQGLRTSN